MLDDIIININIMLPPVACMGACASAYADTCQIWTWTTRLAQILSCPPPPSLPPK